MSLNRMSVSDERMCSLRVKCSAGASWLALDWGGGCGGQGGAHRSERERQASRPLPATLLEGLALPVLKDPGKVSSTRKLCVMGVYE